MAFWATVGTYLWDTFIAWLFTIFVAPFKNFEMLWILIPIYLMWFFAEFFQEKEGTSLGNAITNAVVAIWGGIDWLRLTINQLINKTISFSGIVFGKIALSVFVLAYGATIIYVGVKAKTITKYLGRIREVTYVVVMFTPIYYDVIAITWQHILGVLLFFPLFYYAIELLDKLVPSPKAVKVDKGEGESDLGGLGASTGTGMKDKSLDDLKL